MSYFADLIKTQVIRLLQYKADLNRANQILETVPPKQEESREKIAKAVKAAIALEEEHELSQELYNTYPDFDFTEYGLPEPQEQPLTQKAPQLEGSQITQLEPQPALEEELEEELEEDTIVPDADEAQ